MALKLRRGISANLSDVVPAEGELIYATDTKKLYVGDGVTDGSLLTAINDGSGGGSIDGITDLTTAGPVLILNSDAIEFLQPVEFTGGLGLDLDLNGFDISGSGDMITTGNITISGIGSGIVTANEFFDGTATLSAGVLTGDLNGNVTNNGTVLLDAAASTLKTDYWETGNGIGIFNANDENAVLTIQTNQTALTTEYAELQLSYKSLGNTISSNSQRLGRMAFSKEDATGVKDRAYITGYEGGVAVIVQDPSTDAYGNERLVWFDGPTGNIVMGGSDQQGYKLDVRGTAIFSGAVTATEIKADVVTDNGTTIVDFSANQLLLGATDAGPFAVSNPQTGQVLKWNGTQWANASDAGGGSGSGGLSSISIGADDSALRIVESGEAFLILGGTGISTASDVEGNITITADFGGTWAEITGTPTTLAGYGITDAATSAQGALADTALQSADLGAFTFTASILDTNDSSNITVTPAVVMNSDLTVENNLTVTNTITADTIIVDNIITTAEGTPELSSETDIVLTAGTRVDISSSPLKLASFTTSQRDALTAQNGDTIYNTTTNKFQGYAGGVWVDLH